VQYEAGAFSVPVAGELKKRGHNLKLLKRRYGNMHAILLERNSGRVTGMADIRGEGAALSTH
jgi:gamma-glutamyltranspeptidase/glutathione hydrolase